LAAKDVVTIKRDSNLATFEMPWAGLGYFWVGFNTETEPFKDVRVRQAALYAIDREGMAKVLGYGIGKPHYCPAWAPGAIGYEDGAFKRYDYDPAKVKELLTAAGHPKGIDITLKIIAREPDRSVGEYAQQMWSNVGIRTKLVVLERLVWVNDVKTKNFQAEARRGDVMAMVDPDTLKTRLMCGAENNWEQFCDKDIDRLLLEGGATLDPKKRHEIYRDVLRLVQERAYLGTGLLMPEVIGFRKEVQNLIADYQIPDYRAVWLKA
jgi:ABC-type transport system substrate-binding protein